VLKNKVAMRKRELRFSVDKRPAFLFVAELVKGAFIRTFVARVLAAGGALALAVVIGRVAGGEAFGVFSFFNALLIGAAILARMGTDRALIRFSSHSSEGGSDQSLGFLKLAIKRTVAGSVLLSLALMALLLLPSGSAKGWFSSPEAIVWTALTLVPFSLSIVLSGFLKGVFRPVAGTLQENGLVSLLAAFALGLYYLINNVFSLEDVFLWYGVSSWVVLLIGVVQVYRWKVVAHPSNFKLNRESVKPELKEGFFLASRHYFHMTLVVYLQNFVAVMLLAFMLAPLELGAFKTAEKLTIGIVFVLVVVNTIYAPRFSRAYSNGDFSGLRKLFVKSLALGGGVALIPYLLTIFFPRQLMGFVGTEYADSASVLVVMATAQFVNVLFGPVATMLNMCGREAFVKAVLVSVSLLSFLIYPIGLILGGTVGVALAYAIAVFIQNCLCGLKLKQVIFVDTLLKRS